MAHRRIPGNSVPPHFFLYAAVLLFSSAFLAAEILLVRILSVVFYYHLVFFVVSLAMFGLTIGGMIIYLKPSFFPQASVCRTLSHFAFASSACLIFSFIALFWLPAVFGLWKIQYLLMPVLFLLLSLPFMAFGIVLSLCLTRFPDKTAPIYGVNLIGSALGCLGIVFILDRCDAAGAIFLLANLLAMAAFFFSRSGDHAPRFRFFCALLCTGLVWLFVHSALTGIPRLLWTKGDLRIKPPIYAKWNFHSFVSVDLPSRKPFGWGFSPKVASFPVVTDELMLTIDEDAGTAMTKFNDISELGYLKFDVTSIAYHLGHLDDVLILGAGGGRDALTAAVFGAKNITGVEVNKDVHDIAFNKFGYFSKGIKKYPRIRLAVDEGRSFVINSRRKYDVIQVSLVDSFAAVNNGAFALTENSLYTTDAWLNFLGHLKERGILAFSVWYKRGSPRYAHRLLSIANRALRMDGIKDVRPHMALICNIPFKEGLRVATLLTGKSPFSKHDISVLEKACDEYGFEMILSPYMARDQSALALLEETSDEKMKHSFELDMRPPTDDKPFFFYFAKWGDIFSFRSDAPPEAKGLRKLFLGIVIVGVSCILIPAARFMRQKGRGDFSWHAAFYFFAIGFGFMFVEMSLMQRLGIFLGHPIYGMTVVLFSLFFFSGLGSLTAGAIIDKRAILVVFSSFLLLLLTLAAILPVLLVRFMSLPLVLKICFGGGISALAGFFMGMPFPIGMRHMADSFSSKILCWSINGFASVCGSALSTLLLLHFGFKNSFIFSFLCYFVSLAVLFSCLRTRDDLAFSPESLRD